jgi:hypothetical protein
MFPAELAVLANPYPATAPLLSIFTTYLASRPLMLEACVLIEVVFEPTVVCRVVIELLKAESALALVDASLEIAAVLPETVEVNEVMSLASAESALALVVCSELS